MKKKILLLTIILISAGFLMFFLFIRKDKGNVTKERKINNLSKYCLTGAFLADSPKTKDIVDFEKSYGKNPYFIMVFIDWEKQADPIVMDQIFSAGSVPVVTWEPWYAKSKEGIDYTGLLEGDYDSYIEAFANNIKNLNKPILLRFAHEMNGNWYPWSGARIGAERYIKVYRYVHDIFKKNEVNNVKWIFSVNWEDIPAIKGNSFLLYYPGDPYVDFVGIDGYNWGETQEWSRWITFNDLFKKVCDEATYELKKPLIISEFSSAGKGGDKALWIKEALRDIRLWQNIKAFILFNVKKEVDWNFSSDKTSGQALKEGLEDPYFQDKLK